MMTRFIVLISLSGQRLRLAAAPIDSCSSGLPAPIDGRLHLALPHAADAERAAPEAPASGAGYLGRKGRGRYHQAGHAVVLQQEQGDGSEQDPGDEFPGTKRMIRSATRRSSGASLLTSPDAARAFHWVQRWERAPAAAQIPLFSSFPLGATAHLGTIVPSWTDQGPIPCESATRNSSPKARCRCWSRPPTRGVPRGSNEPDPSVIGWTIVARHRQPGTPGRRSRGDSDPGHRCRAKAL
jgi:hypothetical protein